MPSLGRPTRSSFTPAHSHYESALMHAFADHEPSLWRAVIAQALMDALSKSRKMEARRSRMDALAWLLDNGSDFEAVCDHAGLDPSYVRGRARVALSAGLLWRLPNGQGWRTQKRQSALETTLN